MNFFDPERGALVNPRELVKTLTRRRASERDLRVESCALITVVDRDLKAFVRILQGHRLDSWKGYREVYRGSVSQGNVTVALSPVGAPNVVALAEELAAFGAQKFLFVGYCGSLQNCVKVGDLIVPTASIREEGTSFHYLPAESPSLPNRDILTLILDVLQKESILFYRGPIWTTDAIYRETSGKVAKYREQGVLGVEMELSALFAFGMATEVQVGAILVVSDELAEGQWRPFIPSLRLLKGVRKVRAIGVKILEAML